MKRIAVLGATGSIGRSTLEIARRHPGQFSVVGLAARRSVDELRRLAEEFGVENVVLSDEDAFAAHPDLAQLGWGVGPNAIEALAALDEVDVVVNAVVGAAGLRSTLTALRSGKRCALANKESLVIAGELVLEAAASGGGELIPVDSEHSAILQCMGARPATEVHRVVLTASGGPFRATPRHELETVRAHQALRHPTWDMGAKITIDSATLANKALEVIEAHFLYDLPYDRIDAVVHPTSVVHSFVEFVDGSVIAQMGEPTMELPILCALTWPERIPDAVLRTFNPLDASPLTFEAIDLDRFPLFGLGLQAGRAGGAAPAVFNAANEVAVTGFLQGDVTFFGMADVVEATLAEVGGVEVAGLESLARVDAQARDFASRLARGGGAVAAEHGIG